MELGEQRVDPKLREEGAWVSDIPEMGDLRLKVRGANNKAWEKRQDALISAVPRKMRIKGLDPSERGGDWPTGFVDTSRLAVRCELAPSSGRRPLRVWLMSVPGAAV